MAAPDWALIRPNTSASSTKWYHTIASEMNSPLPQASLTSGAAISEAKAGRPAPFLQSFDMNRVSRRHDVLISSTSDWIVALSF